MNNDLNHNITGYLLKPTIFNACALGVRCVISITFE